MWDRDGYRLPKLPRLMGPTTGQGTQRHGSRGALGWWQPSSPGRGQAVTVAPASSLDRRVHSPMEHRKRLLIWLCLSTWHFLPVFYQISVLEGAKLGQIASVCVLLKYSTLSRTKQSGFGCGVKQGHHLHRTLQTFMSQPGQPLKVPPFP